jgi:hypothetical protein
MAPQILISLLTLIVLFSTYKSINDYKKGITLALSFSILMAWFDSYNLSTFGVLLFIITSLFIIYKGFVIKELNIIEKITFIGLGLFSGSGLLFSLMHWPLSSFISISMVIPIISYLYTSLKTQLKFNKKYLFLTILVLDCVLRFLRLFY